MLSKQGGACFVNQWAGHCSLCFMSLPYFDMITGTKRTFPGFFEYERTKIIPIEFKLEVELEGPLKENGEILYQRYFDIIVINVIKKYQNSVMDYNCNRNTLEIFAKKIWDELIIEIAKAIKKKQIKDVYLYQVKLEYENFYIKIRKDYERK